MGGGLTIRLRTPMCGELNCELIGVDALVELAVEAEAVEVPVESDKNGCAGEYPKKLKGWKRPC